MRISKLSASSRQIGRGCLALAASLALSNVGLADTFFEDFTTNSDGRWIGNGNRSGANNNYGWSDTDVTGTSPNPPGGATASGAGELGGSIQRGNFSDYGYNIGSLTPTDTLHADGVYHWISGSGNWFFGFYNQASHMTAGGDPRNFIGFQLDDSRAVLVHNARSDHNDRTHQGPQQLPMATTVTWSLDYDGNGQTTFVINGSTYVHNSGSGYFTGGGGPATVFNRFGLFPGSTSDSAGQFGMDDITFTIGNIVIGPPTWITDASGDWNASGNWDTGASPTGTDAEAHLLGAITAARTIFANNAIALGELEFDNANTYVITGAGSLSMDVSTGSAQINVGSGSHKINLPLFINDNTTATVAGGATLTIADPMTLAAGTSLNKVGDGALDIISTVTTLAAALRTHSGTTNAALDLGPNMTLEAIGGTTNLNASQHLAGVSIGSNATVRLSAGGSKRLVTKSLSITGGGQLDLTDNAAVIDYTGSVGTLVDETRANLAAGRITSSLATASMRLGYGDNAVLGKPSFRGESIDSSSLLIGFTYAGDADLDGDVDVADLGSLASGWQTNGVWTGGDFDYSGFIDVADLGMLASNWQAGVSGTLGPSLAEALAAVGLPSAAVPEPLGVSAIGGVMLLAGLRRRRASR
jgi:hypothetical protein